MDGGGGYPRTATATARRISVSLAGLEPNEAAALAIRQARGSVYSKRWSILRRVYMTNSEAAFLQQLAVPKLVHVCIRLKPWLKLAHAKAAQVDVQRDTQTATPEIALPAPPPPLAGSQCLAWPHPSV